jgi:hypothetical protein
MVRAAQITGYDADDGEPGVLRVERLSDDQWYDAAFGVAIEAKEVLCRTSPTYLERIDRAVDERWGRKKFRGRWRAGGVSLDELVPFDEPTKIIIVIEDEEGRTSAPEPGECERVGIPVKRIRS